ncbi:MAG: serine/threonine-protein kinase, partial [Planctomycetota bacterium]
MSDDLTPDVSKIAVGALAVPPSEREAFLHHACGRDPSLHAAVVALLEADDEAGPFLDQPALRGSLPPEESLAEGGQVDEYRVIRRIAAGGMGVVYEACQEHPPRRVALKVIRPGMSSLRALRRFEHEADAGTFQTGHGPQPFFAMELIDGQPLLEFASTQDLDTGGRLELFARVCDAAHYAHQRGVIHRDLKPGNILVEPSGQPKILDFGVARLTDTDLLTTTLHTAAGELLGTLPYMSPEQLAGSPDAMDIRSDVYSLGVTLYELLSGRLPYDVRDKLVPEAARIVQDQEPTPLSSVSRQLRGDVDTLVAKALEKDKTRRYQSAAELASDIRRYLNNEPIEARPASAIYQIRKFARRHRLPMAAASTILLAMIAATAVSIRFAAQEAQARQAAQRERESALTARQQADQTAAFLEQTLAGIDPAVARGADTRLLRELLDDSAARIEQELAGQPEVEASLRETIGSTYQSIGEHGLAGVHLEAAAELWRLLLGDDDPVT